MEHCYIGYLAILVTYYLVAMLFMIIINQIKKNKPYMSDYSFKRHVDFISEWEGIAMLKST